MNFMKFRLIYFLISLAVLIPGLFSLIKFGLKPAIDFTGGTLWEVTVVPLEDQTISETTIRQALGEDSHRIASIQLSDASVLLRAQALTDQEKQQLKQKLEEKLGSVEEVRFETIGPTLGQDLLRRTLIAIGLAASLILSYVAFRFKNIKFGVCAILAMFHDTFILLGTFSLLGHFQGVEIDTLFVTAVLTILSFSVHDTIVVYDRIRETLRRHPKAAFIDVVNKSVAETLGRSVNNSMTIIFMLLALYLLGGTTIKWFILALLIGTISGTYSSTFTAAPLLVVWENLQQKK
jgi:preprotein translocase subunit SecF